MTNKPDSVWANVSVPRLLLTFLWALLMSVSGWAVMTFEGRYSRGFSLLALFVCIVLFVRSFKRLMSDQLQEAIERALGRALHFVFRPLVFVANKIATWLGIGRWRGWGEDERTFLGRDKEKVTRRNKRLKNDQKWAEQRDNRARVRFLYIEYMIKQIRAGYIFRRQMTPDEIAAELLLDEDERLLFDTYITARYARDIDIPDETVDAISKATARK